MPKLRKMLGDPCCAYCLSMMQLIETQSKATLAAWAMDFAAQRYLPICREGYPRMAEILEECRGNVEEKAPLARSKPLLREAAALAREEKGPASQAGTDKTEAEYQSLAEAEFAEAHRSLSACAVENEPDPVRVDWNC